MAELKENCECKHFVIDNVLCYSSSARHSMKNDDIVRICVAFYKECDIIKSKNLLCELIGVKPIRRRNENRVINEMKDIMEMLMKCDDEGVTLPKFVVDRFDGLPPTSGFEVIANNMINLIEEVTSLSKEVSYLRESRHRENEYYEDTMLIKEDILTIKGEIRKIHHKLMNAEIRRESLLLDSIGESSRKSLCDPVISGELMDYACGGIKSNKKDNDNFQMLSSHAQTLSPSAPPLSQVSSGDFNPSAPPLSQEPVEDVLPSTLALTDEQVHLLSPGAPPVSHDTVRPPVAPLFTEVVIRGDVDKSSEEVSVKMCNENVIRPEKYNTLNSSLVVLQSNDSAKLKPANSNVQREITSSSAPLVDADGFQLVQNRKRRLPISVIGSKKINGIGTVKGAARLADLYVGNCDTDVTSESILEYIANEMNIKIVKCESLVSKNVNCKSFKVTLNINDRLKLLSPEIWPEGIICRKFYSQRINK